MSTTPLDIINDAQNNINNIANNNKYEYVYNDNMRLVPISFQALCHDEYGLNIPTFVAKQYWDIDASIPDCELNAFKIYSNWKHNELLELAKGTITKTHGLLKKKAIVTDTFSVHSFTNDISIDITNELSSAFDAKNGVEYYGCFIPDTTGTWTFSLGSGDEYYLWVGDVAVCEYYQSNANLSKKDNKTTYSIPLIKGICYPIRVHACNYSEQSSNGVFCNIMSPTNDVISSNNEKYNYFVTLYKNNTLYEPTILYHGLVQSPAQQQEVPDVLKKYKCYIVEPNNYDNYNKIRKLKRNQQLQYFSIPIPTELTYNKASTITKNEDISLNITVPDGTTLSILNAKYGLSKDRVENQPYSTCVPETDSNKLYTKINDKNVLITPTPTKCSRVNNYVTIPSSADVTVKSNELIKNNNLSIKENDYSNQLGVDPAPGYGKQYVAGYKYEQKFNSNDPNYNIYSRALLLDGSGQLVMQYNYNNRVNTSLISSIPNNAICGPGSICQYKCVLENNGSISIYNNSNVLIWNKDLLNNKISEKEAAVNGLWLSDPKNRNFLNIGETIPSANIQSLVSSNGKFKLCFDKSQLTLKYCKKPYTEIRVGNDPTVYYTTPANVNNGQQIYILHRFESNELVPLLNKYFLHRTNKIENIKSLQQIPENYTEILKFSGYNSRYGVFPPLKTIELNNILSASAPIDVNSNYKVDTTSEEYCAKNCQDNRNCSHYFYLNTNNGGRCISSKNTNHPRLFLTTTDASFLIANQILSSSMSNKMYKVKTTCGNNPDGANIQFASQDMLKGYDYLINNYGTNSSFDTYYCSNADYKKYNDLIQQNYSGKSGFTNIIEGVDGTTALEQNLSTISDICNNILPTYVQKQNDVKQNYKTTISNINKNIKKHGTLEQSGMNDPMKSQYEMYISNEPNSNKPDTDIRDGVKHDIDVMLLNQNTLYTLGTITAATFLIAAVFMAK
jgi:hypothetical protein